MNCTFKSTQLNTSKFIHYENGVRVFCVLSIILPEFYSKSQKNFFNFYKNLSYFEFKKIFLKIYPKFIIKLIRKLQIMFNMLDNLCRQFFEIPISKNCS